MRSVCTIWDIFTMLPTPMKKPSLCCSAGQCRQSGSQTSNYAMALNSFELYQATKAYGKTEPLLREAVEINAETLGKEHPHYITSIQNLAALYETVGIYRES